VRPLPPALASAIANPAGGAFRVLVQITPQAAGAVTRYLAPSPETYSGQAYAPELVALSPLQESLGSIQDLSVTVADTPENRAAVVLAASVSVYLAPAASADLVDAVQLLRGEVDDPIVRSRGRISCDVLGLAERHNRTLGKPVTVAEYPGADPDAVGRIVPALWGSHEDHECLATDAGQVTTLRSDLPAGALLAEVSDGLRFPASGLLWIDQEQIAYTSRTADTFNGLTRAQGGTEDVLHLAGAQIAEARSTYTWTACAHVARKISAVYVDAIRQDPSIYTLLLDDAGECRVRFTTLPGIVKQVNQSVEDTIDVDDQIGVSDTIDGSTTGTRGSAQNTTTTLPDTITLVSASGTTQKAYAFADPTGAILSQFASVTYSVGFSTGFQSDNDSVQVWVRRAGGAKVVLWDYVILSSTLFITQGSTANLDGDSNTLELGIDIATSSPYTINVRISALSRQVNTVAAWTKTGAAAKTGAATKTGTVILTGNSVAETVIGRRVTVDIEGYADDGAGTYTGTPGAIIGRPDHVVRHLLVTYGGAVDGVDVKAADLAAFPGDELAVAVERRARVRPLLADLARQSRAIVHWSGDRWIMRRRPGSAEVLGLTPDLHVDDPQILAHEDGSSATQETQAGLADLANRHSWRAGLRPAGGWAVAGEVLDAASQSTYGARDATVELPWVFVEAQALAVVNWRAERDADPTLRTLRTVTTLAHLAAELGDVALVTDGALGASVLGEVVAIGPRHLTGAQAGFQTLAVAAIAGSGTWHAYATAFLKPFRGLAGTGVWVFPEDRSVTTSAEAKAQAAAIGEFHVQRVENDRVLNLGSSRYGFRWSDLPASVSGQVTAAGPAGVSWTHNLGDSAHGTRVRPVVLDGTLGEVGIVRDTPNALTIHNSGSYRGLLDVAILADAHPRVLSSFGGYVTGTTETIEFPTPAADTMVSAIHEVAATGGLGELHAYMEAGNLRVQATGAGRAWVRAQLLDLTP